MSATEVDTDVLRKRAQLLAAVRAFFSERAVLEVDTPVLSPAGATDPHIHSFITRYQGPGALHGAALYLHTSPEFAMKRLLAANSGDIYQIAKVFRDGEAGRWHNPEFTLLEWYRLGFDPHRLMDEVAELVEGLLGDHFGLQSSERLSYREAFLRFLDLDPHRAGVRQLEECARGQGIDVPKTSAMSELDAWRDLLLSHCIEPRLGRNRLSFVYDYPASQAALARIRSGEPPLAERFELYLNGVELANGFHELNDAAEQRRRFEADNRRRAVLGLPAIALDERLLAALGRLPQCSGVALGLDRLLMIVAGKNELRQVLFDALTDGDQ